MIVLSSITLRSWPPYVYMTGMVGRKEASFTRSPSEEMKTYQERSFMDKGAILKHINNKSSCVPNPSNYLLSHALQCLLGNGPS